MLKNFSQEFNTLNYVIKNSNRILLWAHTRPDGDTVGSVLAMQEYISSLGKKVSIGCFDRMPEYLDAIGGSEIFLTPEEINFSDYKLIIACDSADRGFHLVRDNFTDEQVVAILDHHPDIKTKSDIEIIDANYSSVCEIVYDFFIFNKINITTKIADFILTGILYDTGKFQHANTSAKVMELSSELVKRGAHLQKIVTLLFDSKNICTLKLWGRTFEKAKVNLTNGMIVSALTQKDIEECGANTEDISQLASILNTVPNTKFSLILYERADGVIKGSLRSEEYKGVDVSAIAAQFGGGGHRLASGFEVKGKIVETINGWMIE